MDSRKPIDATPGIAVPSARRPAVAGFPLGVYETNCYVVRPAGGASCWIVDAGYNPEALIDHVRQAGLRPEALVLTHAHPDHIAGIPDVLAAFPGTPVVIHEMERNWLANPRLNLSAYLGDPIACPDPDRTMREGDYLRLGDSRWEVRHTPGHSPGGVTLYWKPDDEKTPGIALVGDTLFAGSIGRTDFPGCSFEELQDSIRRKLYTLPDNTDIFPGHGPASSIGREKRTNPFVRG